MKRRSFIGSGLAAICGAIGLYKPQTTDALSGVVRGSSGNEKNTMTVTLSWMNADGSFEATQTTFNVTGMRQADLEIQRGQVRYL